MTTAAMGIFPLHLGECTQEQATARLAWFLAGAYPGGSKRKRVARDFGVSEETAKNWLTGKVWPSHRNFIAMGGRWGGPFIFFVLGPMLTPAEMERRMRANESGLEGLRQEGEEERVRVEAAIVAQREALALARNAAGAKARGDRPDHGAATQAVSGRLASGDE